TLRVVVAGASAIAAAAVFLVSAVGGVLVGTVFTFVAAVALDAAALVLVAGKAAAFNGLSAAGFLVVDTAGFFELGIRPLQQMNQRNHSANTPAQAGGT
ncbi:hypothetical protein, partial [Variovorax sp. KK3]|uniref:hypothetical protein n=1 Tax=Variovorax sp. KK3 TaxID=1855728 RepID=UPI0015C3B58F